MGIERRLNRLPGYDYSSAGGYFISINVHNREKVFGEIINNEMRLNQYGKIAKQCWCELPDLIENCELDEYVIMPDHFHGIVFISVANAAAVDVAAGNRPVNAGNRHACSYGVKSRNGNIRNCRLLSVRINLRFQN